MMTEQQLALVQAAVTNALVDLEPLFTEEVHLTLFARHTSNPQAHFIVTTDSIAQVIEGLEELERDLDGREVSQ